MKPHLPALWLFTIFLCGSLRCAVTDCPCANPKDCDHPAKNLGVDKEIYVFTKGQTDVQVWKWDTITTLIAPSDFSISNKDQANTMCIAHSKQRKFGITVDVTLSGELNETSEEAKQWVTDVATKQREWHADVVMINLLPYLSNDVGSTESDHLALVHILHNVKEEFDEVAGVNIQVACIFPWKPSCADMDASCSFTAFAKEACDFVVINADSFTDQDDVKCRARATIPFSSLLYGLSEYNSHHLPNNRIILGVSWHGYDYTCSPIRNGICMLEEITPENSTSIKCDFSKRKRITNADIFVKHPQDFARHNTSELYNAPYFDYNDDHVWHQVWFEDHYSLSTKYRLVHELSLKGLAIMYADDLTSHDQPRLLINEGIMWSWVGHEFILESSKRPVSQDMHYADTVAGVAVGCLLLGVCLGVVFTCLALRNRVKKPKKPFLQDADGGVDDYTDEDPNL